MEKQAQGLFLALDINNDGTLSREEVVRAAPMLNLSESQAGFLFDKIDIHRKGTLFRKASLEKPFFCTVRGKCVIVLLKLYGTVFICAVFMKWNDSEVAAQDLTWIDAIYFSMSTVTSVGYGDVVPQSNEARVFLIVYMVLSTVVVGTTLGDIMDIFVGDVVGENIVATIIDSTTWIHKADIYKTGYITESDYGNRL